MNIRHAALCGVSIAACILVAAPPAAWAQTTTANSNTVIYDQAYFGNYSVNNAEDMLRVIPGVPAILDEGSNQQERGFGSSGSQVLINGRRFPGKSNEISTSLRRISPQNVERVELVRGTSSDIAVQSQGIVVNLVLKEGAGLEGTGSWDLSLRMNDQGDKGLDGLLSYSGNWKQISYNIGIERNLWSPGNFSYTHRTQDELYTYPNGTVQELRPKAWQRNHEKWIYTAGLTYDFLGGSRLQLNGFLQTLDITEQETTDFIRYDTAGVETLRGTDVRIRDNHFRTILEGSAQYEANIAGGAFNALYIYRRNNGPTFDYRNRFLPTGMLELSQSSTQQDTGEDIIRVSYLHSIFTGMTLEGGAEVARNTLDQNFRVWSDLNSDGLVEEVTIPTAIAHVKEERGEVFLDHKWAVNSKLSVDSSLNVEFSKISNNYPFSPPRELSFWKPRFDVRYQPTSADQIRFLVERTVSQLDFANFVPSYNVTDQRIDAGNPFLSPEKTWTYEVGVEHRLDDDAGVLEGRFFYKSITDYIDKIPYVDPVGGVLISAQGNIPSARIYGAEFTGSVRLGMIGLNDAVLSGRLLKQWSDLDDPFTGESRRLDDDRDGYAYSVSFRQDVRAWQASYGITYDVQGGYQFISDLTSRDYYLIRPRFSAFAERRLFGSTVLRLEIQNLFGAKEERHRVIYNTTVMNGAVRRFEEWVEQRDLRVAVRLRGRF